MYDVCWSLACRFWPLILACITLILVAVIMVIALMLLPRWQWRSALLPNHPHTDFSQVQVKLFCDRAVAITSVSRRSWLAIGERSPGEVVLQNQAAKQRGGLCLLIYQPCAVTQAINWAELLIKQAAVRNQVVHDLVLEIPIDQLVDRKSVV